jgi:hypothetical protein
VFFGGRIRRVRHASILTSDNPKTDCPYAALEERRVRVTAC